MNDQLVRIIGGVIAIIIVVIITTHYCTKTKRFREKYRYIFERIKIYFDEEAKIDMESMILSRNASILNAKCSILIKSAGEWMSHDEYKKGMQILMSEAEKHADKVSKFNESLSQLLNYKDNIINDIKATNDKDFIEYIRNITIYNRWDIALDFIEKS